MAWTVDESTGTISLTRGDSFECTFKAYEQDGERYVLQDGDKVAFAMKQSLDDTEPCLYKELDGYTLVLDPEDTEGLDFGTYWYDVHIVYSDGYRDTYITRKRFKIMQEVHT